MAPRRTRQTCTACTQRKVKCSKTVPCTNCIRRGETSLCTLEATQGNATEAREASVVSQQLSPRPRLRQPQRRRNNDDQDELRMLRRRVADLEARLISQSQSQSQSQSCTQPEPQQGPQLEPRQETSQDEQEQQDTVIEDAASILEFLAWGRHKDPSTADFAFDGADALAGSSFPPDNLQLALLQTLLPDTRTLWRLVDYHVDSLLWFHTSFHAPTFRRQLQRFLGRHGGRVEAPGVDLLWVALLFAVLTGSITCAPDRVVREVWTIGDDERAVLSRRWFRAVVACLNRAEYTANLSIVSVQAICTLTMSAHLLGFSNMQSIHLAAAVRIAQSLGLHRMSRGGSHRADRLPDTGTGTGTGTAEEKSTVEVETGRRVWLQLCCQDWFGIPFSESCLIHPLHSQSQPPANCHDEGPNALQPLPDDVPTVTSYCRFLTSIASIMPQLQDGLLSRSTPFTRYEQVLAGDRRMRMLATAGRPGFLASVPLDPAWPAWVPWARRSLAISSAHKIIMIHRAFLSESLTNPAYAFTRRTCLAAAKTIIKEYRCIVATATADSEDNDGAGSSSGSGPVLWVHQAFSVAAAIILILDVLHRHPAEPEYVPHLQLAEEAVHILRRYPASQIAVRGVKLLSALLREVRHGGGGGGGGGGGHGHSHNHSHDGSHDAGTDADADVSPSSFSRSARRRSRGLNVPSFVRSFCGSLAAANRQSESSCTVNEDDLHMFSMHDKNHPAEPAANTDTQIGSADCFGMGSDGLLFLPSSIDSSSTFGNLLYLANCDFPATFT